MTLLDILEKTSSDWTEKERLTLVSHLSTTLCSIMQLDEMNHSKAVPSELSKTIFDTLNTISFISYKKPVFLENNRKTLQLTFEGITELNKKVISTRWCAENLRPNQKF